MKREIKFRAWDKVHECYLYDVQGAYDTLSGCVKYENGEDAVYDEECFAGFLDNDQYVVEQYTGLHDKNGREIYEGDIVRSGLIMQREKSFVGAVRYGRVDPSFTIQDKAGHDFRLYSSGEYRAYEVIGNIFEDKQLLEVAEHE